MLGAPIVSNYPNFLPSHSQRKAMWWSRRSTAFIYFTRTAFWNGLKSTTCVLAAEWTWWRMEMWTRRLLALSARRECSRPFNQSMPCPFWHLRCRQHIVNHRELGEWGEVIDDDKQRHSEWRMRKFAALHVRLAFEFFPHLVGGDYTKFMNDVAGIMKYNHHN